MFNWSSSQFAIATSAAVFLLAARMTNKETAIFTGAIQEHNSKKERKFDTDSMTMRAIKRALDIEVRFSVDALLLPCVRLFGAMPTERSLSN